MAFDAGMVMAVSHELRTELLGSRVEKVQQPEKDEVIILHSIKEEIQSGCCSQHLQAHPEFI